MSTEVVMPQMGESLSEGTVIKWYKKPGESVERDEPLFEITTDKVDTEVPAPESGVLQQILVGEGETVSVGTVVARIGPAGAEASPSAATEAASPSAGSPQASTATAAPPPAGAGGGHFRSAHEPQTFQRRPPADGEAAAAPAPRSPSVTSSTPGPSKVASATGGEDRRHVLSPAVASLAARHQIPNSELTSIPGTGRGGRITKKDVLRYVETRGRGVETPTSPSREDVAPTPAAASPPPASAAPTPKPPPPPAPTPPSVQVMTPSISTPLAPPASSPPPQYLYQPEPDDRLVPMSQMRRQIAEHMLWSQQISAQVTSFTECDMHRIVGYRDEQAAAFEQNEGVPLSFLPFVAEASVRALKEFPIFNASVVGDQIAYKRHVHLGIAVSLEEGLVAPVIRNADEMNFVGLARSIHEYSERARTGHLRIEDVQGASFTVTNPGLFGGLMGTPMISQPQVAILGLGAVQKKPVVIDDAIAIRPVMVLALSFDHRVIDGATGFQFIEKIRTALEQFQFEF